MLFCVFDLKEFQIDTHAFANFCMGLMFCFACYLSKTHRQISVKSWSLIPFVLLLTACANMRGGLTF